MNSPDLLHLGGESDLRLPEGIAWRGSRSPLAVKPSCGDWDPWWGADPFRPVFGSSSNSLAIFRDSHYCVRMGWGWVAGICVALGVFPVSPCALAIDLTPASQKIERALEAGMVTAKARIPPDLLYAGFGPHDGMKPKGYIMTRVIGLRV